MTYQCFHIKNCYGGKYFTICIIIGSLHIPLGSNIQLSVIRHTRVHCRISAAILICIREYLKKVLQILPINSQTLIFVMSHTSQMRKFKGISRIIKRSTANFQGYFWKTVVTLLFINKISSNFSHLFQDLFWPMQHSKEVSII